MRGGHQHCTGEESHKIPQADKSFGSVACQLPENVLKALICLGQSWEKLTRVIFLFKEIKSKPRFPWIPLMFYLVGAKAITLAPT